MPRVARVKSKSGIYHIIIRGINRQILFEENEDRAKFIQTLHKYREICKFSLYAYCLMGNHLHLLIMEGSEPLENVMRRICSGYVLWYNKKYDRIGYLFQDRYKSEPVEDDAYFLTALRYIFQNPVKAGIVSEVKDYIWTNYIDYIEESNKTDTDFALNIINSDRERALMGFVENINKASDDKCLDIRDKRQLTDEEIKKLIKEYCQVDHVQDLQKFTSNKRNMYLKSLKDGYGLSVRQLERLTGIGRGIIQRA